MHVLFTEVLLLIVVAVRPTASVFGGTIDRTVLRRKRSSTKSFEVLTGDNARNWSMYSITRSFTHPQSWIVIFILSLDAPLLCWYYRMTPEKSDTPSLRSFLLSADGMGLQTDKHFALRFLHICTGFAGQIAKRVSKLEVVSGEVQNTVCTVQFAERQGCRIKKGRACSKEGGFDASWSNVSCFRWHQPGCAPSVTCRGFCVWRDAF